MPTFEEALSEWKRLALKCLEARVSYERVYAVGTMAADGKNADARKAQVDVACIREWEAWKRADVEQIAAWQVVLHLTNTASATRPVLA